MDLDLWVQMRLNNLAAPQYDFIDTLSKIIFIPGFMKDIFILIL